MFISDIRNRRERPDVRMPARRKKKKFSLNGTLSSSPPREEILKMTLHCWTSSHTGAVHNVNKTVFTSKEQIAPAFGIEGAESEANENHRGSHESRYDNAAEKQIRREVFSKQTRKCFYLTQIWSMKPPLLTDIKTNIVCITSFIIYYYYIL